MSAPGPLTDSVQPDPPAPAAAHALPPPLATGSALDLRSVLLDPAGRLHGDHMRRRGSDISRVRPTGLVPDAEAIELTVRAPSGVAPDALSLKAADVESAVEDVVPSFAPSVADDASAAPLASPTERMRQRRKARLCFAALCWLFFGLGWNDGSTGPLLPKIQQHYNVSPARSVRRRR